MKAKNKNLSRFQEFLHKNIPMSKKMGLMMSEYNGDAVKLDAPISLNINDKGSVFGGSGSSMMILAAWSLVKLNCEENNIIADIVIHKNETVWHKAMYSDLIIEATFDKKYDFMSIKDKIMANKHQRINCVIKLIDIKGDIFSTMTAKYVIIPKS